MTSQQNVMEIVNRYFEMVCDESQYRKYLKLHQKELQAEIEAVSSSSKKSPSKRPSYDPQAPRAKGARMIFYEEQKNLGTIGVKAIWDGMSSEQKEKYEELARISKAEANYKRLSYQGEDGKRKSPSKAKTGKELYIEDGANKDRIRKENPGKNAKEIKTLLTIEWAELLKSKSNKIDEWVVKATKIEKSIKEYEEKIAKGEVKLSPSKKEEVKSKDTKKTEKPLKNDEKNKKPKKEELSSDSEEELNFEENEDIDFNT